MTLCGVCGTDAHIHEGEFIAEFPLIPGHETTGVVVGMVPDFKLLNSFTPCLANY